MMKREINNYHLYFLLSPVAWGVYFTAVYLLIEAACTIGLLRDFVVGLTLILMVPTLGLVLFAGYKSQQLQSAMPTASANPESEENREETLRFSARVGLWLSGLFVILTLGVGATALVLQPC